MWCLQYGNMRKLSLTHNANVQLSLLHRANHRHVKICTVWKLRCRVDWNTMAVWLWDRGCGCGLFLSVEVAQLRVKANACAASGHSTVASAAAAFRP